MENYEQKYKEALERARISRLQLLNIGEEATEIEHIFPELTESEDERIKKDCIKYLDWEYQHCSFDEDKMKIEKCVSWLEKQKQKTQCDVIEEAFNKSKTYEFLEKVDATEYSESILPTSVIYGENDDEYKLHKIIEAAYIAGQKNNKANNEWTEKDEMKFDGILAIVEDWVDNLSLKELEYYGDHGYINWLKSLKERIKK